MLSFKTVVWYAGMMYLVLVIRSLLPVTVPVALVNASVILALHRNLLDITQAIYSIAGPKPNTHDSHFPLEPYTHPYKTSHAQHVPDWYNAGEHCPDPYLPFPFPLAHL